jgi:hypothetical protein
MIINVLFSRTVQRFPRVVLAPLDRFVFATAVVLATTVHRTVDGDHHRRRLPVVVVL